MKKLAVRLLALTLLTLGLVGIAAPAQAAPPEPPLTVIFMGGPPSVEHRTAFMLALADCLPQRLCTYWNSNYGNPHYDYAIGWVPVGPGCADIGQPWDEDISSIYNRLNYDTHWRFHHACISNTLGNFDVGPNTAVSFGGTFWNDKFSSFFRCPIANFNC